MNQQAGIQKILENKLSSLKPKFEIQILSLPTYNLDRPKTNHR